MRFQASFAAVLMIGMMSANAQMASHAPTVVPTAPSIQSGTMQVTGKTVASVNGTSISDRELLTEMYILFPYGRQHNGFPEELEPQIRRGALDMIIFNELVYQEAKRRGVVVSATSLAKAEAEFRKQFPNQPAFDNFLQAEMQGSRKLLREKIRRALMIDAVMKAEVEKKSAVSPAEARAFYQQNIKRYEHGEQFAIQTISIMPPRNAAPEIVKEARNRADEALRRAKATKSFREFGLLAEQLSDDDWRVNMGDRHEVDTSALPPPLVAMARTMKKGQVSDLLQFGQNYTLFRLNNFIPAGRDEFSAVQQKIQGELQKVRYNKLRAEFHKKLRSNAKVELL